MVEEKSDIYDIDSPGIRGVIKSAPRLKTNGSICKLRTLQSAQRLRNTST
jgi:hypothetical protein